MDTATVVEAIAWERAPRYPGRLVNRRVVCADGFTVSIQASVNHYANDSHPRGDDEFPPKDSPYWRSLDGSPTVYPFTTFEIGNPTEADLSMLDEWDSAGVWAWVPREEVTRLLDSHGGAVGWEEPRT